jgi:twinkle protein
VNDEEYEHVKKYMHDQLFFINPEDDFTIDSILSKAKQLVKQKGIKILVIDPYNKLEHKIEGGTSETNYISKFLDKLTLFAKQNMIMVFLVAHPVKMKKDETNNFIKPTLYDINGSANFYNKTDFGIVVHRDYNTNMVEIDHQKVKFKHLGEGGPVLKVYNFKNGRYESYSKKSSHLWDSNNYLEDSFNTLKGEEKLKYAIIELKARGLSASEIKRNLMLEEKDLEILRNIFNY